MSKPSRRPEIRRRRTRKDKLAKLRRRYSAAGSETERSRILEKLQRIAPHLPSEKYLREAKAARDER